MFSVALFFSLLYVVQPDSITPTSNECEGSTHPGNWICVKNEDSTLNVTFDCDLNGDYVTAIELWLWSPKFPENMKSLTVKNCKGLSLDLNCNSNRSMIHFSHLNVVNVEELQITRKPRGENERNFTNWQSSGTRERVWWNLEDKEWYESEKEAVQTYVFDTFQSPYSSFQFPKNVVLNKIEKIYPKDGQPLISDPPEICFKDIQLESFKMINVSDYVFPDELFGNISTIKELTMDNVKLEFNAFEYEKDPFKPGMISNKEAVVKITDSVFSVDEQRLFDCNVSKLLISGSTFKGIRHLPIINCTADEFVFTGNTDDISDESIRKSFLNIKNRQ